MRNPMLILLIFGALLAGCSSQSGEDTVLATVGDRTITVQDFQQAYRIVPAAERPDPDSLSARLKFLDDIINKEIMEIASYDALPELNLPQQWRMERFRRTNLTNLFKKRLVGNHVSVSEADIQTAYEHKGREVFLEGILLPEGDMAREMRRRLDAGEATFEEICRDYSIWESANPDVCGEIGWSSAGQLTNWDMEVAVWDAQPGDIVGPYLETRGWWVLRVGESRSVPVEGTKEDLHPMLKNMVEKPRYLERDKVVLDSLMAEADPRYTQEGQLLLLEKFEWTPPEEFRDDPMARYNVNRIIPEVTEEEGKVPAIEFGDGRVWDTAEFLERASWYPSGIWPVGDSVEELQDFCEQLVRDDMYIRAAVDLGLEQDPEYLEVYNERVSKLRVNYLYHNIVVGPVEPTQEEIMAWYRDNRERYRTPPSRRLALFSSKDGALMQELREAWISGASFAELRDAFDPRADDLVYVGDSGWLHEGDDPGLDAHLENVDVGQVAPIFARNDQAFVIRVLDYQEPRLVAYEEAKEVIDKDALTWAKDKALKDFLADYRERLKVTVDEKALAAMELSREDPDGDGATQ